MISRMQIYVRIFVSFYQKLTAALMSFLTRLVNPANYVKQHTATPQLTLIGFLIGLSTGLFLLMFKLAVDYPLEWAIGGNENFESLAPLSRFLLPLGGSIILAVIWAGIPNSLRAVGVPHVLEKMQHSGGRLPGHNLITQFVGGSIALLSGQSVGREGPAVHLGAGLASVIGQRLNLPNSSIQTLVGCGVAGAIAAFFNTPLAGVLFAMEVILVEYSIASAVPIMASAFAASLLSQGLWAGDVSFENSGAELSSLLEIPYLITLGLVVGTAAALFNAMIRFGLRFRHWSVYIRFPLAGLITGSVAFAIPEVMGTGYDTIALILEGHYGIFILLLIFFAKLMVTASAIGLGIPAGLIGPTLVIGSTIGGLAALLLLSLDTGSTTPTSLYVLMGTSAMMSAVLQAPMAALMTVLEFSSNTNILFPAMLTIIVANLTCRSLFKQPSIFTSILQAQGLSMASTPVSRAMRSVSATEYGIEPEAVLSGTQSLDRVEKALERVDYLTITSHQRYYALPKAKAMHRLEQERSKIVENEDITVAEIDLNPWVADHHELIWMPLHATLDQVLRQLQGKNIGGVRLSERQDQHPRVILPREHVLEFLGKIGG
jgi:CIC family chloride channel protein